MCSFLQILDVLERADLYWLSGNTNHNVHEFARIEAKRAHSWLVLSEGRGDLFNCIIDAFPYIMG